MSADFPYFDLKTQTTDTTNEEPSSAATVNTEVSVEAKKKPVNRCCYELCIPKRKLMLTDVTCKCGFRYCMSHRDATAHKCQFDYKAEGISQLKNTLVKTQGSSLKDRL